MDIRDAVFKLFSAGILKSIIEFVAIAYFTRILGASAIGSFFLYQSFIGVGAIISNLGLRRAAEKELSAGEDPGEVISTVLILKSSFIIPVVLLILYSSTNINSYIGIPGVSSLVALGLITAQGNRLVIRLLAGQMRVEQTASIRLLGKLTWVGAGACLIYLGMDAYAIILAFIIGDVVIISGGLFRLDLAMSRPTKQRAISLLSFGRYIFLRSAGSYTYSWMDVAILGFFVPQSYVGAYEIAWRVASLSITLTGAIRESIFPIISDLHVQSKNSQIGGLIYKWIQPPLYLTIPGLFGAVVLGEKVLGIPFGEEIIIAFPVLIIFMGEKILRAPHIIFSSAVYAMDKPELGYRGEIISLSANLLLNILLIPEYGILGAGVATAISSSIAALINAHYLSNMIDLIIPWSSILWSSSSSFIMAAIVYLLESQLPDGWLGLIFSVSIGIFIYFTLLLSNKKVRNELKSLEDNPD